MKGRVCLVGLLLLLVFTAAVYQELPDRGKGGSPPLSADMVVVGSGIPALTAALEAALLGAEVLLLDHGDLRDEFMPPLGGRFVSFLEETSEDFPQEELVEAIKMASPGIHEERLMDLLAGGRETLSWLTEETGLSFSPQDPHHSHEVPFQNPGLLEQELRRALLPRLRAIIPQGEPRELLVSDAGRVTGMRFLDGQGQEVEVMTQAVVLASGGFLENRDFMKEDPPFSSMTLRTSGVKGTAYDLTRHLNARIAHPERVYLGLVLHPRETPLTPPGLVELAGAAWFSREGRDAATRALDALESGEEGIRSLLLEEGPHYLLFPVMEGERISGLIHVEGIGDLAGHTQLSTERWEEIAGHLSPPFALGRLELELLYTMGGLAVDGKGRVLGPRSFIPGLYCLGEAAGGFHGEGIYPGLPLTEGLVEGRKVGREAALYSRR